VTTRGPAMGAMIGETPAEIEALVAEPAKRRRGPAIIGWWIVFIAAVLYFFVPLYATLEFALRSKPFLSAFTAIANDSQFLSSITYSFVAGLLTIAVSIVIIVPTAFWVRLRYPRARPWVEFITLLPFVIPPIILVFGLLNTYKDPPLPFTQSDLGSNLLLIFAYTVLSFPYMYRAVDNGLRSIDVRTLTEASQSLGAGWLRILWQVILPNLRTSLLSGAFLTLAIVVGEFTIATFLARPAFAPYLNLIGADKAYEQAALALVSFAITWLAMILIAVVGRGGGRGRVSVAGAR